MEWYWWLLAAWCVFAWVFVYRRARGFVAAYETMSVDPVVRLFVLFAPVVAPFVAVSLVWDRAWKAVGL